MTPPLKHKNQEEAADGCYPPARFSKDGTSPYFIGKNKMARKRIEKSSNRLTKFGFGGEGFISENKQEIPSLSSATLNGSNGMSFDFHADPKLRRVKEVIVSIVDSERKRENDKELHDAIASVSSKSMEMLIGGKPKKSKCWEKQGIASINDFKMASGGDIVKEMKQVVCDRENISDVTGTVGGFAPPSSENVEISKRYLGTKKVTPVFSAPPPIKRALHMMDIGGGSGAHSNETGLHTEPTLKHFDANLNFTD
ncbi:hypothetical protein KIN20_029290 [Parelaphostrongylus tenuis]|uniref:Uncharacterized protein n=1 Tax=Parelaphostrongylus tenuis TaxID=148309 RepID=A0AAD5WFF8_PARTN|nr:hypothetical protein KIN20_029290 [Parelaphostrongylus tenuis]